MRKKVILMGLAAVAGVAVAATLCLSGCANLGYYWQSVNGHLGIMNAARPVDELVQNHKVKSGRDNNKKQIDLFLIFQNQFQISLYFSVQNRYQSNHYENRD